LSKLFTRQNFLYLITDRSISGLTHIQVVQKAISAGIKTIQLREKEMSKKAIFDEAVLVRQLTLKHKVTFIVNDFIDIAMAVNADGVHLGQEDMPAKEARKIMGRNRIIGISTHNLKQAVEAQESGADYIGFGPMFHTGTKDAGHPKGTKKLRAIKKYVKVPVVAIGGITLENVNEVLKAGADAVAVVSGILSGNIRKNAGKFFDSVK
jgi:thiamine-phosphate pyrophosphorylase